MNYAAPLKDMMFVMRELAGLEDVRRLPGFEEANDDTVQAVLEEASRFNAEVVAPLNRIGDEQPSAIADGVVTTPPGFREAFRRFGKGRHSARLNFGDLFAYALARASGEPLLSKGDDFARTDIEPALAPG